MTTPDIGTAHKSQSYGLANDLAAAYSSSSEASKFQQPIRQKKAERAAKEHRLRHMNCVICPHTTSTVAASSCVLSTAVCKEVNKLIMRRT